MQIYSGKLNDKIEKIFVTRFGLQKELRQTKMVFLLMELHGRPKSRYTVI